MRRCCILILIPRGICGKYDSRDMAWAAYRYTEAKLDGICQELFGDIDKDSRGFCG